jgi:hypothetical protein
MARAAVLRLSDLPFEPEPGPSWDDELRAFLNGDSNGGPLLHAIYDDVMEEAIPARLLKALRG